MTKTGKELGEVQAQVDFHCERWNISRTRAIATILELIETPRGLLYLELLIAAPFWPTLISRPSTSVDVLFRALRSSSTTEASNSK